MESLYVHGVDRMKMMKEKNENHHDHQHGWLQLFAGDSLVRRVTERKVIVRLQRKISELSRTYDDGYLKAFGSVNDGKVSNPGLRCSTRALRNLHERKNSL